MVTGASTAELTIVLVDARKGVQTQSKRHGFLASLLGIPHVVVAINKMDLVDFSESVYQAIVDEYREFALKLDVQDLTFIPISALLGDNVVEKSANMPWYDGATLLHYLETVSLGSGRNLVDFRFPVQYVIRPTQDYRGYAGRIASGTIQPGEEVVVLPSGHGSRVRSIDVADGSHSEAAAGESVVLTLEDEVDVSRGDMLVRRKNLPVSATRFDATLCWMSEKPLDRTTAYVLQHTTRQVQAYVSELVYRIDVDTLHREDTETLGLNEIARVELTTSQPLFFDAYEKNRETGGFILVDPHTHATVAAGMIRGEHRELPLPEDAPPARAVSPGVVWEDWNIPLADREASVGHSAAVLWLTGLSGAGKSTVAKAVEQELFALGCRTILLDGDQVRHGLCGDLGFAAADRTENIRRVSEVAKLCFEHGNIVLCTFVSPFAEDRQRARALIPDGRFLEIHVHADLDTVKARDPKGLYEKAGRGEIPNLTGVSSPYEAPDRPELRIDTSHQSVERSVDEVLALLRARGILRTDPA
jgi:bifunctional enzyme CysN/CysC